MTQWDRTTPWRQGFLLTDDALRTLCEDVIARDAVGVVISHSCDLAQPPEAEPFAEIIVGTIVCAPDGNFSHAKSARRLHLAAKTEDGGTIHIELRATNRRNVGKELLAGFAPNNRTTIPHAERDTLQRWLAARYRRSTFPDEFNRRLDNADMPRRLSKLLAPLGREIVCLFFDVDNGREQERNGATDTYLLTVSVLYTDQNNEAAAEVAEAAAEKIRGLFKSKFWGAAKKTWSWIELELVDCLSTEALSYEALRRLKQWNADYISLRADEEQPTLE